tara:strand:- start:166 stop:402 length:237 start_codon:yes stop_codon:yes gene_type:complete
MGRKEVHPTQRKISLTLSVPFFIWEMAKANGHKTIVDLIILGLWSRENNINQLSLHKLKEDYERKILALQSHIENEAG